MQIRHIENKDKQKALSLMREFYASDAVSTNGSEEIFVRDVDECLSENPYSEMERE